MFQRKPWTIRFQLLLAVNTAMAVVFTAFVVFDYQRELSERLAERHVHMEEEAKTLLQAILRLRHHGLDAVQEYIDAVCGRMRESESPGHHVAVMWESTVLQAEAHHRSSREMFDAMLAAARSTDHRAKAGGEEIVVGSREEAGVTVFVSEYLNNLRRGAVRDMLRRLAGIVVLGLLAAAIANYLLLRLVVRPVGQLVATVQQIAAGQLGVQSESLNSAELSYLAGAINAMSTTLADADREHRQQMAKAREIQQHLLPRDTNIPGMTIAHLYRPATEVAGDYYDVVMLPDRTWLLCVADVTGHGVPAAMEAAILKAILLHATEHHSRPDEILAFMNDRFTAVCLPDDFASVLLVRWDPANGNLDYASAGHESGWILSANGILRELPSTGPLLGVAPESKWEIETLPVSDGDRLLLVTDGATEAVNSQDELFGRKRLAALFQECRGVPLAEVSQRIDDVLTAHRGDRPTDDDMTLVVAEFGHNRLQS
jgi:serine phosphatase RsbU (regulator of sigma subunit)